MKRPSRDLADEISGLAARRGFFWNAYEIYGGVSGFITWGPYGSVMKRKIADLWRKSFVVRHGFVEIDTPTISPYPVFEASGHIDRFNDIMATCLSCGQRFKAVELLRKAGVSLAETLSQSQVDSQIGKLRLLCPECGGELGRASTFTTMFQTTIGPLGDSVGFMRPETAQGMFTEFKRAYSVERKRMPLGVAQLGRGFRNEISPRQGPIRLREFDMMELELFYDPENPKCPFLSEVEDVEINLLPEAVLLKEDQMFEVSIGSALEDGSLKNEWLGYFMGLAQGFMSLLG
ncbi:MAG: glycine--tRNA ligase, partial [Candidatus Geothermarchaeales archaeon]